MRPSALSYVVDDPIERKSSTASDDPQRPKLRMLSLVFGLDSPAFSLREDFSFYFPTCWWGETEGWIQKSEVQMSHTVWLLTIASKVLLERRVSSFVTGRQSICLLFPDQLRDLEFVFRVQSPRVSPSMPATVTYGRRTELAARTSCRDAGSPARISQRQWHQHFSTDDNDSKLSKLNRAI